MHLFLTVFGLGLEIHFGRVVGQDEEAPLPVEGTMQPAPSPGRHPLGFSLPSTQVEEWEEEDE